MTRAVGPCRAERKTGGLDMGKNAERKGAVMSSVAEHGGTDLGRRILRNRYKAGLTREEAAARAGMAPSYLKYLETSPAPTPTPSALARLAGALEVSTGALAGAALRMPPGVQPPVQRPVPEQLGPAQCRGYLGAGGVGRFVFAGPRGPVAIPVNYVMLDGDIVVRTGRRTSLADGTAQSRVSFEVDHLDQALAEAWSVLASGEARLVATPSELETVRSLGIEPWAGGGKDAYLRITITEITGRRILARTEAAGEPGAMKWRPTWLARPAGYSPGTTGRPAARAR